MTRFSLFNAFRLAAEFAKFFMIHFTPSGDAWDGSPNDPRLHGGRGHLPEAPAIIETLERTPPTFSLI